jgi:hypothetical protein
MDPVTLVVIIGFLGGVPLALILRRWQGAPSALATPRPERLATDVINMARIKVSGVGGLGMVAMAATIALAIPRIGQTLATGFVLGIVLAFVLIVRRRRRDPAPVDGGPRPAAGMLDLHDRRAARPGSREEPQPPRPRVPHTLAGPA